MKTHYTHNYLLNPYHPLTVAVVGAGGTGSQVMQGLARIDYALCKLGHPGLTVTLYDDDTVTEANIGRQLFSPSEIGLYKATVLADRINSFFGTDWESQVEKYPSHDAMPHNITLTCVDNVKSRLEIGSFLRGMSAMAKPSEERPYYWLDFGNQSDRGQVVLGAVCEIPQPKKSKNKTASSLKCVDELFDLNSVDEKDSGPSCSLAEALNKQDLFINSAIAQCGCTLLWKLISEGGITCNGVFINQKTMQTNPIRL